MAGKSDGSSTEHRQKNPRRVPLGDGASVANINANAPRKGNKYKSPLKLDKAIPKNESLIGNGTFAVRHTVNSTKPNRVSQISEEPSESKRNSAISTTSTNASGTGRKRKTHIGPWQLGATVGKGGTARVRKVKHAVTGQIGVAKIIPVAVAERARAISLANLVHSAQNGDPTLDFGKQIPLGLEREIAIMKLLKHPNIVRLYDVWENRNEIYLIMEYVEGGELFEYIANRTRLHEDVTVYLFRQIVLALKHCHGLNIHHRDLKPENILLDYDAMTVKIVDFGMAALQPEGNFLTTPCGSPHYAAPELLCNRPYDGSQADVWSAGVVLFVMLTGYPPFNFPSDPQGLIPEDHKLKGLFRAITRADYRMPAALSPDAQDLIRKIFVLDPSKRINIDEVWHHPFVHKYDYVWGLDTLGSSNSLMELAMAQDTWIPLRPKNIDREIFRALRTLWHSESDTVLTDRLCSNEFNQEKFFYHTMLLYRNENLENMQNSQNIFEDSGSDYQHDASAPPLPLIPVSTQTTPLGKMSSDRPKSTYSISGDDHLMSKHSYYDLPASEASYDPFRASRSPVIPRADHAMTVYRLDSKGAKKHATRASRGESLRVGPLHGNSRRRSRLSSQRSSASASIRRKTTGKCASKSSKSSSSRFSTASSYLLNGSPMPVMRPSELHKRGVQFSHKRRSSTGSALSAAESQRTPDNRARALRKLSSRGSSLYITASPAMPLKTLVVCKKTVQPTPRTKHLNARVELEARKVSAELGKVCDEAFWRSSMSSSLNTTSLQASSPERHGLETPPSSVSRPSPVISLKNQFHISESMRNRPLPPTPMLTRSTLRPIETPTTFTAREFAEMRERLALKYAREGAANQKYFNDVLTQLDNLMKPIQEQDADFDSRRIVSAPPDFYHPQASIDMNSLDAIPEEGGPFWDFSKRQQGFGDAHCGAQVRTEVENEVNGTIKVVAPSPPSNMCCPKPRNLRLPTTRDLTKSPWSPQPLNIRKQSSSTTSSALNAEEMKLPKIFDFKKGKGKASKKRETMDFDYSQYMTTEGGPSVGNAMDYSRIFTSGAFADTEREDRRNSRMLELDSPERRGLNSNAAGFEDDISPVENRANVPRVNIETSSAPASYSDLSMNAGIMPTLDNPYQHLDDRPQNREQRAAATKATKPNALVKGLEQVKNLLKGKAKVTGDSESELVFYSANTQMTGIKAIRTYDGQKNMGEDQEVEYLQGFRGWILNKGWVLPGIKPAIKTIPVRESRAHVWGRMIDNFFKTSVRKWILIFKFDTMRYTVTFKVIAKKLAKDYQYPNMRKNVTVDMEFFNFDQGSGSLRKAIPRSIIRIVQVSGPADCVKVLADIVQQWLVEQDLEVRDPGQAEEMKLCLYDGLRERRRGQQVRPGSITFTPSELATA